MGWKPGGKKFYITALENRVAELEGYLATTGHSGLDDDHWKQVQRAQEVEAREPPQEFNQAEEVDSLLGAIRDLSLSANGHYIGGTSTITLGRLLGSVIKGQNIASPGLMGVGQDSEEPEEMKPKSITNSALADIMGPWFSAEAVSTRLYEGYIKHISTRFPVLHTPRVLELHQGREHIDNPYDDAILHLVYATGGRFLETVWFSIQCSDTMLCFDLLLTVGRQERRATSSATTTMRQPWRTWMRFSSFEIHDPYPI
jgi:hypothetical protein